MENNQLLNSQGKRLYLTEEERAAFMSTAKAQNDHHLWTFCGVLHHTGCRISEALELTANRVDLDAGTIVFRSLKKQSDDHIYRAVPAPPEFLDSMDLVHRIRAVRKDKRQQKKPLWSYHRATAWRKVTKIMIEAGIPEGPHRTTKGLWPDPLKRVRLQK